MVRCWPKRWHVCDHTPDQHSSAHWYTSINSIKVLMFNNATAKWRHHCGLLLAGFLENKSMSCTNAVWCKGDVLLFGGVVFISVEIIFINKELCGQLSTIHGRFEVPNYKPRLLPLPKGVFWISLLLPLWYLLVKEYMGSKWTDRGIIFCLVQWWLCGAQPNRCHFCAICFFNIACFPLSCFCYLY